MKERLKKEIQENPFYYFLLISSGVHILFIILILSSSNLWSVFRKDKEITPASIRVDMVGLPDITPKKVEAKKKKEKPVFIPEKKKKVKKPKKKPKKKDKKKEKNKKKDQKKNNKIQNTSSDSKKDVVKGNQVSKGAKEGEVLDSQQMEEMNIYFSDVESRIRSYWNLPKYLIDLDLKIQIEIRINNQGKMTSKKIVVSSGNDLFDSQALKAMENASPYSPPPASVRKIIRDGIVFNLRSRN